MSAIFDLVLWGEQTMRLKSPQFLRVSVDGPGHDWVWQGGSGSILPLVEVDVRVAPITLTGESEVTASFYLTFLLRLKDSLVRQVKASAAAREECVERSAEAAPAYMRMTQSSRAHVAFNDVSQHIVPSGQQAPMMILLVRQPCSMISSWFSTKVA
eukprot:768478-Hanusia_phi.AAC.15